MSNHHFRRSAGIFASRVAKPECRTTIFTGWPGRLLFYHYYYFYYFCYFLRFYYFSSIRFQAEVLASRVAKPECPTTIFTSRPDRLLFYYSYYFMSIRFQAEVFASRVAKPECRTTIFAGRPAVFASRVAKPECRTTVFTGRPAVFASRVAKPECRTTIFTGWPGRLLFYHYYYFYYFCYFLRFYYFSSIRFQAEVLASRVAKPECPTTIFTSRPDRLLYYYFIISFPFGSRQRLFACRAANPTRPPHPSIFQSFFCISDSLFCMSAHVFACRPNVSPGLAALEEVRGPASKDLSRKRTAGHGSPEIMLAWGHKAVFLGKSLVPFKGLL